MPNDSDSRPAHDSGVRKGERLHRSPASREAGRHETGKSGAGRPHGKASGRSFTGINAKKREPIDPRMPVLQPA